MQVLDIRNLLRVFDRNKSFYSRHIREHNIIRQIREIVFARPEDDELSDAEKTRVTALLSEHIGQHGEQNTATGNFVRALRTRLLIQHIDIRQFELPPLQLAPLVADYAVLEPINFQYEPLKDLIQRLNLYEPVQYHHLFPEHIFRQQQERDFNWREWDFNRQRGWHDFYRREEEHHATSTTESDTDDAERGENALRLERAGYPDDEIPHEFLCPITYEIITDPVRFEVTCTFDRKTNTHVPMHGYESHAFERSAIEYYLQKQDYPVNPMSNERVSSKKLISDTSLKNQIDAFVINAEEKMRARQSHSLALFRMPQDLGASEKSQQNRRFTEKIQAYTQQLLALGDGPINPNHTVAP